MPIASVADLSAALRETGLLTDSQMETYSVQARQPVQDVRRLIAGLLERRHLTAYQVEQLTRGKGHELVVSSYCILEPLGSGGMGQVFKAHQRRLNRTVAIKFVNPEGLASPTAVQRFEREAHAAARLHHPNIITVFDANEENGRHYIVMEFAEGIDLERMVERCGKLSVEMACDFMLQSAHALQYAHENGIVHRDIKPSNILVANAATDRPTGVVYRSFQGTSDCAPKKNPFGTIKILDMGLALVNDPVVAGPGIAPLTAPGTFLGTADYVSPEQTTDPHGVDIRSDIYSLGCVFYFLLAGRHPFPGGTLVEKLLCHQSEKPTSLKELNTDVPKSVRGIIRRMMKKDPKDRYQTPAEIAADLEQWRFEPAAVVEPPKTVAPIPPIAHPGQLQQTAIGDIALVRHSKPPSQWNSKLELDTRAQSKAKFQAHQGCVLALRFSDDGNLLATTGVDGKANIWDIGSPQLAGRAQLDDKRMGEWPITDFVPNAHVLAAGAGHASGLIWFWDWTKKGSDACQVVRSNSSGDFTALAISPDGKYLASSSASVVDLWSLAKKPPRLRTSLSEHRGTVRSIAFAPNGRSFAVGCDCGLIWLWRIGMFRVSQIQVLGGAHSGPVTSLAYSPDGAHLATGDGDGEVLLWDPSGRREEPSHRLGQVNGPVQQLAFLAAGRELMALARTGQVKHWNLNDYTIMVDRSLDQSFTVQVALCPQGRFVAAANSAGVVTLYGLGGSPGSSGDAARFVPTQKSMVLAGVR